MWVDLPLGVLEEFIDSANEALDRKPRLVKWNGVAPYQKERGEHVFAKMHRKQREQKRLAFNRWLRERQTRNGTYKRRAA